VILLDTSGLLAALFSDQRRHRECARVLGESEAPLILSPFVLAELDYLVTKLAGQETELRLLDEVAREAYQLVDFSSADIDSAREVIEGYTDLGVGLADSSIVVLSQRYGTRDLLTLDERHFRALRGAGDRPFRILPADVLGSR
jgi:predicted nucleic acid-binding protein